LAKKPLTRAERLEVVYSEKHWKLLNNLRARAAEVMVALSRSHIHSVTHGSIARGDVSARSDVDVFIPEMTSSFAIETALERAGFPISRRVLVQATPTYSLKGFIEIDDRRCVSFSLSRLRKTEREFYRFGGEAVLQTLKENTRVPGVDKRLMLIEPTASGHVESSVIANEEIVASILGISVDTVLNRVHVLLRRDKVGRTGLFIERDLTPDETFDSVLKKLEDEKPSVRRRLRTV